MPWKITDTEQNTIASSDRFFDLPLSESFPFSGFAESVESDHTFTFEFMGRSVAWVDPVPVEPVPETAEQARLRARYAIEAHIQSKANEYGFDSIITAGYRAALPESQWHTIGKALALWADECWVMSNVFEEQIADEFTAGTRTAFPTNEEVINALPAFTQV